MANQVVNTLGTPGGYATPTFAPFQSGCTKCNPSHDYYNYYAQQKEVQSIPQTGGKKSKKINKSIKVKKGGSHETGAYSNTGNPILIPKSTGENLYVENNYNVPMDKVMKNNLGIDYATSGGSKSKNSKKNIANNISRVKALKGGKNDDKKKDDEKKDNKKKDDKKKNDKKKMNGGDIATDAMPLNDFKTKLSGGKKDDKKQNNKDNKKQNNKKNMRGGQETAGATSLPQRWFDPNFKEQFTAKVTDAPTGYNMNSGPDFGKVGGSKVKKVPKKIKKDEKAIKKDVSKLKKDLMKLKKNKKSMKGGQESSGATSMDAAFYNPSAKVLDFPSNSGEGIMSAYGAIKLGNIGTGMLAPYTASTSDTANHNTMQQTGGKKKLSTKKVDASKKKTLSKKVGDRKKSQKGGDGPIPYISDSPVSTITGTVNNAINGFSSFMQELDNAYQNSINEIKNVKIGDQRLIQGGGKKKSNKKSVKESKLPSKINKRSIKKGGNGSAWSTSLNSRGPWNAPDDNWGVPGELWFRQFNKTGDYIPNSRLAVAATPELAGVSHPTVSGYDESIFGPTNSWA